MKPLSRLASTGCLILFALGLLSTCGQGASAASAGSTSSISTTTPVDTGFGGQEDFCAQRPLGGEIDYDGTSGAVAMRLAVRNLPRSRTVVVNWVNDPVRGYEVGYFATNRAGSAIATSLRLTRPGEERGYKIVLTTAAINSVTLGVLWPCGPPPRSPASTVDNPRLTVTPSTGLRDGQVVQVRVAGFGVVGKVWLSECDHAEDANGLGCGLQLAEQRSLITDRERAGSSRFIVHSSAPTGPRDTTNLQPCSRLCVIVAVGGGGAWTVAPIAFATSSPTTATAGGFTSAKQAWVDGASSISAGQNAYLLRAASDLASAINAGGGDIPQFQTAIRELKDLASLPETSDTPAQRAEAHADLQALNAFFGTAGLYE